MPPISVFRFYLTVFVKMVTEIIILYHKVPQRDLLATFCFNKIDFIMKQCGKITFSQKIFLTAGDSDMKGLLDYVMHYIIKYVLRKSTSKSDVVLSQSYLLYIQKFITTLNITIMPNSVLYVNKIIYNNVKH